MVITPEDLEFSILRIFERQKVAANGHISEAQLHDGWRKTRLRKGDLKQGLALLIARDAIKKTLGADEPNYQLTQLGFGRMLTIRQHPIRSLFHRMRIQTMLSLMRSPSPKDRFRRAAD